MPQLLIHLLVLRFRDKSVPLTEDFRTAILEQHKKVADERQLWQDAVARATAEKNAAARALVSTFESARKKARNLFRCLIRAFRAPNDTSIICLACSDQARVSPSMYKKLGLNMRGLLYPRGFQANSDERGCLASKSAVNAFSLRVRIL